MTTETPVLAEPKQRRRPLEMAARAGGIFLGAVFLFAAFSKLIDPAAFAEVIEHEGLAFLLPAPVVAHLAIALEVGLGVALLSGLRTTGILALTTGLTVFFLFLTGRAYVSYVRGDPDVGSCGCFGSLVERTPAQAFFQDALLLVPALVLAWFERPAGKAWRLPRVRGIAAGAAAVLAVVFALLAPGLPLDGLVTKLSVGERVESICVGKEPKPVCLRDALPLLLEGANDVVLADVRDPAFRAHVEALNARALEEGGPRLWVVTSAREEEVAHFRNSTGPVFDVVRAEARLVRSLYRRLPRSFRVENGVVTHVWDGLPPQGSGGQSPPVESPALRPGVENRRMRVEVRRRPSAPARRGLLALALLACVALAAAPASRADDPPVHPLLRDFQPSGKYVLRADAEATSSPTILFSKRAAAYLLRGSAYGSPLLVRTVVGTVESVTEDDLVCREDGACDLKASVRPKDLGRVRLEGADIVIAVPGLTGRLVPTPPLLGWQRAKGLAAHTPEYLRDAKSYRLESACLEELRAAKSEVRVFVYFGSWCPTCNLLLGRILRVEQELAKGPAKVQFDYYGLPGAPKTWVDPEVTARNVDRIPSAIVYVDGKYARRIVGHELSKPESALAAAVAGR